MKSTLTNASPDVGFLIDSDCDPRIVYLLRRVGFKAKSVLDLRMANDDTRYLIWAREHGFILVCHDKHRDQKTRYSFYSEMYYRGGRVIRIGGEPGQAATVTLGKILSHMPAWQEHFNGDSGQVIVNSKSCDFTPAHELFRRTRYVMRLPFDDPAVPLKNRAPLVKKARQKPTSEKAGRRLL